MKAASWKVGVTFILRLEVGKDPSMVFLIDGYPTTQSKAQTECLYLPSFHQDTLTLHSAAKFCSTLLKHPGLQRNQQKVAEACPLWTDEAWPTTTIQGFWCLKISLFALIDAQRFLYIISSPLYNSTV